MKQNIGRHGQTLFSHASKICVICEICGFRFLCFVLFVQVFLRDPIIIRVSVVKLFLIAALLRYDNY